MENFPTLYHDVRTAKLQLEYLLEIARAALQPWLVPNIIDIRISCIYSLASQTFFQTQGLIAYTEKGLAREIIRSGQWCLVNQALIDWRL